MHHRHHRAAHRAAFSQRPEERAQALASWRLLAFSGLCLTVHFGAWVWSLEHTSLAHSLLFVCSVPVLIALGTCVLRQPITNAEVLGSVVAFGGGMLLALGPRGNEESGTVTVAGDMAALLAAIVFIGYLQASGQALVARRTLVGDDAPV